MFDNLEGSDYKPIKNEEVRESLTPNEANYINECVAGNMPLTLIDRIDEMSNYQPPKGIDHDSDIADIIESIRDQIDSKYLEAPSDLEQISQISDYLAGIDELKYENWTQLEYTERKEILQQIENKIAEIEHRDSCCIRFEVMEYGCFGSFSPVSKDITLNSRYIASNEYSDYKETIDTLIHEGRHAYQDYNIYEREVHPRSGEVSNWKWNENQIGYQIAEFAGFEAYAMQPVETDARAFAEDVLTNYLEKTA